MDQLGFASESQPLKENLLYKTGMTQIHAGQWRQALKSFQTLQASYPDDPEIKKWLQEIHMRATLIQSRSGLQPGSKQRFGASRLIIVVVALIILAAAGYVAYVAWIDPILMHELRLRRVTELRQTADEAIAAGDYAQAHQALQQLQRVLPEDPKTLEALKQIEQVERLSGLYLEAKALMSAGEWDQAIEALTELQGIDAQYRDLPQLLAEARKSQTLNKEFQLAEEAFRRSDWEKALTNYQGIQQADITFRFDDIQARIFESHLKFGQMLVFGAANNSDRVAEALVHFSEALKLQPLDQNALYKRRLGETYLAALNSEEQDEVIALLQSIYEQQPDYANQAAAELLYNNLVERGASLQAAGKEAAATADYQAAARLLVEDVSVAQEKLAELTVGLSP